MTMAEVSQLMGEEQLAPGVHGQMSDTPAELAEANRGLESWARAGYIVKIGTFNGSLVVTLDHFTRGFVFYGKDLFDCIRQAQRREDLLILDDKGGDA